jgi:diguanylate cyclase (GGDEF)-like protein
MGSRSVDVKDWPSAPSDAPDPVQLGHELGRVRRRLRLLVLSTAVLAALAGALAVLSLSPETASPIRAAIARAPVSWRAGFIVAFTGAAWLTFAVARLVILPALRLDAVGRHYSELYDSARQDALQDSLTGLGNHRAFQEEFERQLELCRRHGTPVALALLDIDDFKAINDGAGHAAGDGVLADLARAAQGVLRSPDRAFRIGGDEFAVLFSHTGAEQARIPLQRLLASALEPPLASSFPGGFSFSAGITSAPEYGTTRDQLLAQADQALYAAKRHGRTLITIFDSAGSAGLAGGALVDASRSLLALISRRDLRPVYQPIVDLASGRVLGFEGLVRPGAESGFANPGSLFEAAATAGRTIELDRLCIETVLAGAGSLRDDHSLALNVSPDTIEAPEFGVGWLLAAGAWTGFAPSALSWRSPSGKLYATSKCSRAGSPPSRRRGSGSRSMTWAPATRGCDC